MNNKKGLIGLNQLSGIVMLLVIIGLLLTTGLRTEKTLQSQFTENSTEWNATKDAMEGLSNVADNQGLLGTIIVFAVIISLVMVAFAFKGGM